jgi:ketosteroid isomerase-like protein
MSEENVEIARRFIEALTRGDLPNAMKETPADFSFDFSRSISPERGVYGRDDIPELVETFFGDWESLRYEPDEFIVVGDQLITPINIHFRGRDGIEVHTRFAWVWLFRDGQVADHLLPGPRRRPRSRRAVGVGQESFRPGRT